MLSDGHDVQIKCVSTFENSAEFNAYASCNKLDVIIGIHAFRAGQLIYGKFSLILSSNCWARSPIPIPILNIDANDDNDNENDDDYGDF